MEAQIMEYTIWAVIVILVAALVYFVVGAVAALTLTKAGDHPQYTDDPATFGLAFEDVRFRSRMDHLQIAGWFIPNRGAERAIILVHGRDASKQNAISGKLPQLAAELHGAGLALLMIDLRGHGESEGKRYTFGVHERRDVLGAVDFLVEQGFAPGQIGVLGISLGGAAVIGAAVEEAAIGAIVVESTFADINMLVQPKWKAESGLPLFFLPGVFLMWQLLIGFDLRKVKPVEELAKISPRPILVLHSQADQDVDVAHALAIKNAIPEVDLVIFEDCSHAELFRDKPEDYLAALIPFLRKKWGN
jgi:alpha-beta hydrolase superfamily lysophospholipase